MKIIKYITLILIINNLLAYSSNYKLEYYKAIGLAENKQYNEANEIFDKLINTTLKNEDYEWALDTYTAKGYNYELMEEYSQSIKILSNAILLYNQKKIDNYSNILYLYKNYANVNGKVGNYVTALEYYNYCLNKVNIENDIELYIDYSICIAATKIDIGMRNEANKDLNKLYMLIMKNNNNLSIQTKIAYLINLSTNLISLNEIDNADDIYNYINKNYYSIAHKEYYFSMIALTLNLKIHQNQRSIDSIYANINFNKLNELENYSLKYLYNNYLINNDKSNNFALNELLLCYEYFHRISNYKTALEIFVLIDSLGNFNVLNKKMFLHKDAINLMTQQNHELIRSIRLNNKLNYEISNSKIELKEAKLINLIYLIIIITSIIISFFIFVIYFKQKIITQIKNTNYNKEIERKSLKFAFSNNLREMQMLLIKNNKEDIKDIYKNIFNNLNNIKDKI